MATRWPATTRVTCARRRATTTPEASCPGTSGSRTTKAADAAVLVVVQVRAADAAGAQAQQHVVRAQRRRCLLLQAQVVRAVDEAGQ